MSSSFEGAFTMNDGRRVVLYHPRYVEGFRNALREAKADLAAQHLRHQCTYADLLAELTELRDEVRELREIFEAVVRTLRQSTESDVAQLRRELERALLRLAPPHGKPLH